ncbi:MAG TPA: transglycosylase SLT domain-containing protein, partial [Nevskiaceae bacterium]
MRLLAQLALALWLGGTAVGAAAAAPAGSGVDVRATGLDPALFPEPAVLQPAVRFWTRVFGTWGDNQSVVHSSVRPYQVVQILTFDSDGSAAGRRATEKQAVDGAERALRGIVAAGGDVSRLSTDQRQVYDALGGGPVQKFQALEGTLRVQRGLRERTRNALTVAGRYLPSMERIFANYGLPRALTRLPIVESSFDLLAYSKVGAAGIWQFMPAAARIYMTLDAVQDDRRDPWTSTDAAARFLRDNHEALGTWPLAITAYNYGRGGVQRALAATGGATLADLVERYDNPRFGFASSNFYAEFLAANVVATHAAHYYGPVAPVAPVRFDTVTTSNYVPYRALEEISGADATQFAMLNPAFSAAVVDGHMRVPPGATIRVPAGEATRFKRLYADLGPAQRFDRQRSWYVSYRVRRGDALTAIAQRHRVSVERLVAVNQLHSARHIRVGQVLRIPTEANAARLMPAAAHTPRSNVVRHRVQHGQTLSGIAER